MELKKRAVFFSIDALIALLIILFVVLLVFPVATKFQSESQIHSDVLNSISTLKVSEIDSVYVSGLISSGAINDSNASIMQQLGEFYVSDVDLAREFAENVLGGIESNENFGIWYGSTLIYSNNRTAYESANEVDVERQVIGGLQSGESVTGFSARAFLSSAMRSNYYYFGGYAGDGNISLRADYSGEILSAVIELTVDKSFEIFVNGVSAGTFSASPSEFQPVEYEIPVTNFVSGENVVELRGNNIHVSGGFIKIVYESDVVYSAPTKKFLPGTEGLINIYDGLYVPGELESLDIYLHMETTQVPAFLTVGNTTVFQGTTDGEENIHLSDLQLSSVLDYNSLWGKTIPIRLGLQNVSYDSIFTGVDIYSVTDISGSMSECAEYAEPLICEYSCVFGGSKSCEVGSASQCTGNVCGGSCFFPYGHGLECSVTQMDSAKEANENFIDTILNYTGNRVGLQAYSSSASASNSHDLSTNSVSLKNEVNSWTESGNTCICCGINAATASLASDADPSKLRAMVVMSDGEANVECAQQGTGDASQDAIKAACDARNDYNVTVHSIAFGIGSEEATMQAIANCGGGSYYYSDVSELGEIYQEIAEYILAQYLEQTVVATGNISGTLYPDSYFEYSYASGEEPFGLILTLEKDFDNATSATLSIPNESSVSELVVASYSGSRWTDNVYINGERIYSLSDYGLPYVRLGDPYLVNIPTEKVLLNQSNIIDVTAGLSAQNSSAGSEHNKLIYTLVKNASTYSPIVATAQGCIWNLEFEDGSFLNVTLPNDYSGSDVCNYNSASQELFNENDAFQLAVLDLLSQLDTNGNGLIDSKFTQQDLEIDVSQVSGIPFTWYTEVQVRRWLP